jgi:hypothetical protein
LEEAKTTPSTPTTIGAQTIHEPESKLLVRSEWVNTSDPGLPRMLQQEKECEVENKRATRMKVQPERAKMRQTLVGLASLGSGVTVRGLQTKRGISSSVPLRLLEISALGRS